MSATIFGVLWVNPAGAGETLAPMVHSLRRGETLARLAIVYGVALEALLQANPGLVPEQLAVGTSILIPQGDSAVQSQVRREPEPDPDLTRTAWVQVVLPDGRRAWAPTSTLLVPSRSALDADQVVATAVRFEGIPYQWGGVSPNGVDCSGFVHYVYWLCGHCVPRMADAQFARTVAVDIESARPGDLVFFSTYEPGPSHVGVYLGHGEFLHASSSGQQVRRSNLDESYYRQRLLGVHRLREWIPAVEPGQNAAPEEVAAPQE